MIPLAAFEKVIDASGVAPRIEATLPIGVRSRQLSIRTLLAGMCLALADHRPDHLTRVHQALTAYLDGVEPMSSAMAWQQPGPSASQIGQSAHGLAAGRTGTCGSWTLAETHPPRGATWTSTRSAFLSCTGASNAHVSTMPTPCAKPPGSCLMLPMRTSRRPWPMSWPGVTGTPGPSRPGPCGTGRLPPPGGPRQRHWHLVYRRDASAMTPGPMRPSPMAIRPACRVNPMRVRIIWACRAGTVTNSSGIRGSASCPATSPIERSVPRRRCYCSRSCCSPPQPGGEQPAGANDMRPAR